MKRVCISATLFICSVFVQGPPAATAQEAARTIEVHAKRFSFSPAEITLKKVETVKLVVTSDDVTHSLVIPDLHVDVPTTQGHPGEATITPDKAGDFKGKCGHVCGIGHGSMKFVVHVTNGA